MADQSPTDLVPVLRQHLREVCIVVNDAYNRSAAEDLVEAFKTSRPTTTNSALTRRLERSLELLGEYLGIAEEEQDVSENVSVV